jgi:hypothetical protein
MLANQVDTPRREDFVPGCLSELPMQQLSRVSQKGV